MFRVERSVRASLAGLQDGRVSIAEITPSPRFDRALAYDETSSRALSVTTTPSPVLWQLVFNLNDPVVGARLMRVALALVTDTDQLVADSIGLDDPLTVSADSSLFAQGQPGPAAGYRFAGRDTTRSGRPSCSSHSVTTPISTAGFARYGVGSPLTLTVTGPKGNGVIDVLEQQLQAEWASCGIRVDHPQRADQGSPEDDAAPGEIPARARSLCDACLPDLERHHLHRPRCSRCRLRSPRISARHSCGSSSTWLWSVPTPVGTEPGATTLGAVTRDIAGLEDPDVAAYFEKDHGRAQHGRASRYSFRSWTPC